MGNHYEVVLVEYDPKKTSYEVLLHYAWRNIDPFNGNGQFCDYGSSYRPAIFYDDDEERDIAHRVRDEIIKENNHNNNTKASSSLSLLWNENNIAVPILSKPKFWMAEEYHQNYYIKNPGTYNYYKKRCGRENRLKQVWGEEVYYCYHDLKSSCFRNITNTNGTIVRAQVNIKNIPVGKASILPKKISIFIIVLSSIVAIVIMITCRLCCLRNKKNKKKIIQTSAMNIIKQEEEEDEETTGTTSNNRR